MIYKKCFKKLRQFWKFSSVLFVCFLFFLEGGVSFYTENQILNYLPFEAATFAYQMCDIQVLNTIAEPLLKVIAHTLQNEVIFCNM